ncbi:MAG TPA: PQQ-dependent sugar dehydrogenase [Pyrinomonadaceae bacterium]
MTHTACPHSSGRPLSETASRLALSIPRRFIKTMLLSLAIVCLTLSLAATREARAQTFADTGFSAETVTTLPPYKPVGLTFAPDGRIFIWQENGIVRIFKNGALLTTPFVNIQARVNTFNDRGMLGLALDPNFTTNGYVYLLYTYEEGSDPNSAMPKTARLTRVKADPANPDVTIAGSETVILGSLGSPPCSNYAAGSDCIPSDADTHSIGTLRFAPDGKLLVSIGDGAGYAGADPLALRAQDLNSYAGKILRINPDGSAPGNNPFDDGTNSIRSKVYSYGLRNPYRFTLQPVTGEVYLGDVGWSSWEEVNRGRGVNFGWPCFEGQQPQPFYQAQFEQCRELSPASVVPPLYSYSHLEGNSVIGGSFYTGTQYPAQYRGNYFFADYGYGFIRRMTFDASGNMSGIQTFATDVVSPVSLELGPDGALYYISLPTGEVRRIKFSGPVAKANANPLSGYSPLNISFSSAGSLDPAGGSLTYHWDFGDGATSNSQNPAHTYTSASVRAFNAVLTVTDSQAQSAVDRITMTVGSTPPNVTISNPVNGAVVTPGDVVNFQGAATDPDETLQPNALAWTVLLHHNDHVHPFTTATGAGGSFTVESHGEGAYSYEIILTATDSSGLTSSRSINLPVSTSQLPTPWLNQDIGATGAGGSASYLSGAFTLHGAGADIWDSVDAFHFVYQSLSGDGEIVARVATVQNTHSNAKAGLMIREALSSISRHATLDVTPAAGIEFLRRQTPGATTDFTAGGNESAPKWLKLKRVGNSFSAYKSDDGLNWTLIGTDNINMAAQVYIGLIVNSHAPGQLCPATLDNVRAVSFNNPPTVSLANPASGAVFSAPANITIDANASDSDGQLNRVEFYAGMTLIGTDTNAPYNFVWNNVAAGFYTLTARAIDNAGAATTSSAINIAVNAGATLPSPWLKLDIGSVGFAGDAGFAGGVFTLHGSGADIWDNADAFHFVYRPMSGNGQIIARVTGIELTDGWAKAGVMIRETLAPGARHAAVFLTASNGLAFQRRTSAGGISEHTEGGSSLAPVWVKLIRKGNLFTAYSSADGATWTQLGQPVSISMTTDVYIGLAVTSHNNSLSCASIFDNVGVKFGRRGVITSRAEAGAETRIR